LNLFLSYITIDLIISGSIAYYKERGIFRDHKYQ
jgi:hypothetical protein